MFYLQYILQVLRTNILAVEGKDACGGKGKILAVGRRCVYFSLLKAPELVPIKNVMRETARNQIWQAYLFFCPSAILSKYSYTHCFLSSHEISVHPLSRLQKVIRLELKRKKRRGWHYERKLRQTDAII